MKLSLSLQQDFQAAELVLKRGGIKKVVETTLRFIGTQATVKWALPVSIIRKAIN